ncbi:hypothetical protein [Calothrix sp. 336/3]|uniref:hypothetical protein n=1 Tax=Calothrix sp. 336/3 TaxID=1337936 RepID=UPI0004E46605|nr:hypothetical protein [Calothrix sp. 336/3]AKG24201.1 hypothetical protein IJ00_25380 [Calothrix sp. 336/3]
MKFTSLLATMAIAGMFTIGNIPVLPQASAQEAKQEMKDVTGLTTQQKVDMLIKSKGQFGSGDQLRRYFFGDLEPIGVQPGGAGMVVNLYNKTNDITISYCATYDVVITVKKGKIARFSPNEVK